jgi:quinol-cytochrome oxidoreductase complex cytochrome b subunit
VVHVIAFPLVAAIFLAVHFWRIRKDGGISGPPSVRLRGDLGRGCGRRN